MVESCMDLEIHLINILTKFNSYLKKKQFLFSNKNNNREFYNIKFI